MALDLAPRRRHVGHALLPLGLVFLTVGVATAVVGPFLSLFLSTAVHAGPIQVTGYLVVAPLSGVVTSTLLGRLSDRYPIRRKLLIAAACAGVLSTAAMAVVRQYWVLLALAVPTMALAGSLFPQTFAYARQVLTREDPARAAMGISSLRTVFSLAWVAGPPLGAFLLDQGGFRYVYGMASVTYTVAALVAVFLLSEQPAPQPRAGSPSDAAASGDAAASSAPAIGGAPTDAATATDDGGADDSAADDGGAVRDGGQAGVRRLMLLTAVAFTLAQCPLTLAPQALALYISNDLGGEVTDAGLILGLCAALEIPLMLGLGALTTRVRLRPLILAGAACGVAYYAVAAAASGVWMLTAAQILNALFIAAVSGLGISYMQEMLPQRPGQATTLFTNTFPIGAMLAGPLFGVAQQLGYRLAYGMSTGLAAAGLLLLLAVRPRPATGAPAGAGDRPALP